jgi:DNA-directed RNA polymerase specialized sigma subunit
MVSPEGARRLIDNIFIEDELVMRAMQIDRNIINKLRYVESAADGYSLEECAAKEQWHKLLGILEKTLATLADQEQDVLKWRYGLEEGKRLTQREVGIRCGFTAERARQVENKALRKLRLSSRSCSLIDVLNSIPSIAEKDGIFKIDHSPEVQNKQ